MKTDRHTLNTYDICVFRTFYHLEIQNFLVLANISRNSGLYPRTSIWTWSCNFYSHWIDLLIKLILLSWMGLLDYGLQDWTLYLSQLYISILCVQFIPSLLKIMLSTVSIIIYHWYLKNLFTKADGPVKAEFSFMGNISHLL